MEATRDTQSASLKGLALGFIGGFIATLIFHELAFLVLNSVGLTSYALYSMAGVPPLDVPRIISLAFWGGVFGLFYPFLQTKFGRGLPFLIVGILFGAIVPTLCSWTIVNAIKGIPIGPNGGWAMPGMAEGPIVNGMWGLGTALFLALFNRQC
jgi:hypothetical protein